MSPTRRSVLSRTWTAFRNLIFPPRVRRIRIPER